MRKSWIHSLKPEQHHCQFQMLIYHVSDLLDSHQYLYFDIICCSKRSKIHKPWCVIQLCVGASLLIKENLGLIRFEAQMYDSSISYLNLFVVCEQSWTWYRPCIHTNNSRTMYTRRHTQIMNVYLYMYIFGFHVVHNYFI